MPTGRPSLKYALQLVNLLITTEKFLFSEKEIAEAELKNVILLSFLNYYPNVKKELKIVNPEKEALSLLSRIMVMHQELPMEKILSEGELEKVHSLLNKVVSQCSQPLKPKST